ncbi:hypothetical protein POVCU2_0039450 [Plasmodium ovale curtisi]|uniref:Uncharacterized protein n=1 Tax=Plasmodium ovale curtisi TaxID=864141 RepID=A0A1A8W247_PLAOA|nr:hypothetical protein POVCU2_0039450 [Plasmodium ovale curtisi]
MDKWENAGKYGPEQHLSVALSLPKKGAVKWWHGDDMTAVDVFLCVGNNHEKKIRIECCNIRTGRIKDQRDNQQIMTRVMGDLYGTKTRIDRTHRNRWRPVAANRSTYLQMESNELCSMWECSSSWRTL